VELERYEDLRQQMVMRFVLDTQPSGNERQVFKSGRSTMEAWAFLKRMKVGIVRLSVAVIQYKRQESNQRQLYRCDRQLPPSCYI
jgi:hypothetical protein